MNHMRVYRLCREEGLQPPTPLKEKRARPADGSVRRLHAEHPHLASSMDTVRHLSRLKAAQVPEGDRRAQPPLPGDPGGQELQGQSHGGGAGGAHQPLAGPGLHLQRQRSGV